MNTNVILVPDGIITLDDDHTDGGISISIADAMGESTVRIDNYQGYILAMKILRTLDVVDTRGSK